jgi:hypothetical protein
MSRNQRWSALLVLLALAAGLAVFDRGDEGVAGAVVTVPESRPGATGEAQPARTRGDTGAGHTILALRERAPAEEPPDYFAPHHWNPPPQATPAFEAPPPPPAPTAPPLPFTVLGKQHESDVWRVFLSIEDRLFVVKAGDMIDDTYRVESIELPVLTLTYLPLNERQTLAIGGAE